jgi:hypothetical protein
LFNYKYHNFTQEPENDPNQSWLAPEEDDFYDQNDEEVFGDMDKEEDYDYSDEEELNEAKMYYHVLEDGGYGDIGHQGVYDTKEEAQNRADKLADMFPASSFYVEASDSKDEPYNVTMEENKEVKPNTKMKKSELKEIYIAHLDKELDMSILSYMADVFISNAKDGDRSYKQFIDLNLKEAIFDIIGILNSKRHPLYKDALEEYNTVEADKARGIFKETKSQSKMKKSELKAKIKEMIVAETNSEKVEEVDFLAELEGMLDEASEFDTNKPARIAAFMKSLDILVDEYHAELYLSDDLYNAIEMVKKAANDVVSSVNEAAKDEEVDADVEAADDTTGEDTTAGEEAIDTTVDVPTTEVNPDVKSVQDALTQAQAAAQKLGDPKLTDQIGNTITFFTRSHVVEKPNSVAENLKESMFPMLKRILK